MLELEDLCFFGCFRGFCTPELVVANVTLSGFMHEYTSHLNSHLIQQALQYLHHYQPPKSCGSTQGSLVNRTLGTGSVHFQGNIDEKEHELCPRGKDEEIRRK